jgi:quercetin 2,3-dioxygenase
MLRIRRSDERGHANHGWLESYHTFSFADYYDPEHMGFGTLRVINEDRIQPGAGFPTHGHRDMEIVTYVLDGELEHKDSLGNGSTIRPGDVQRLSAGTGIRHSEYNASNQKLAHFLQIWILPNRQGMPASYEQKHFSSEELRGRLRPVATPHGDDGSVTLQQDAAIYAARLASGDKVRHTIADGRRAFVHVARGSVEIHERALHAGDGAAIEDEREIRIIGGAAAEILLFDLT